MSPKFAINDALTVTSRGTHAMPGDTVTVVRIQREIHNGRVQGYSYSVINPGEGITVPFKMFEAQLAA